MKMLLSTAVPILDFFCYTVPKVYRHYCDNTPWDDWDGYSAHEFLGIPDRRAITHPAKQTALEQNIRPT
jgi:hypothetical protein